MKFLVFIFTTLLLNSYALSGDSGGNGPVCTDTIIENIMIGNGSLSDLCVCKKYMYADKDYENGWEVSYSNLSEKDKRDSCFGEFQIDSY